MSQPSELPPTIGRIDEAIRGIEYPDAAAAIAARSRQDELVQSIGSLGRLEDLSIWAASTQAACPPADLARPRLVIFAGDHGVASNGRVTQPSATTAELAIQLLSGGGLANLLADLARATIRVVDLAAANDTDPSISAFKVRRASGNIDREDAMTLDQARQALEIGAEIADAEIESGADLLMVGDLGVANATPASVLISVLTATEPVKVVGRGPALDDAAWIAKCAAIRDARHRAWPHRFDMTELLSVAGGADIAAMTGFILWAAYRKTPVLIDSVVTIAAALVAHQLNARVVRWLQVSQRSAEPAHDIALERLGLRPIQDLQLSIGEGAGSLLSIPTLRAAIRTLSDSATWVEIGADRNSLT